MATRNPHLQTRSEYGHYWGVYATEADLPNNTAALVAPGNLLSVLEQGDIAYVQGPTPGFWQCDNPGTFNPFPGPGNGDAVWSPVGGAFATQDRFAPTFLVGNTAAGDSNVPYNLDGFNYYPDTGNGAQLALALAAAAAAPHGRVYIRRGTYDLGSAGAPATPLVVASSVAVQGEGDATIIQSSLINQGVFNVTGIGASIEQLTITAAASATSAGSAAVVRVGAGDVTLADLRITFGTDGNAAGPTPLRRGIDLVNAPSVRLENIGIRVTAGTGSQVDPSIGIGANNALLIARSITITDGDHAIVMDNTTSTFQQLVATGWNERGLLLTTGGTLTMVTGRLRSNSNATQTFGIEAAGDGHTLIDVDVINLAVVGLPRLGIGFTDNGGNVRVDNCRVTGEWFIGIQLGTPSSTALDNSSVTNCRVQARSVGVEVPQDSVGCNVSNNQIECSDFAPSGPAVTAGILIGAGTGSRHVVAGNRIDMSSSAPGLPFWGIDNGSSQSTFEGNTIVSQERCIRTTGERNIVDGNTLETASIDSAAGGHCIEVLSASLYTTVNGNVCLTTATPYAETLIEYAGDYGTCSNNITRVTFAQAPVETPGIRLTAQSLNCNAIGNVCRGTTLPASIVADAGSGNNVSNNVGAL